jgi:hypothetical protein
MRCWYKIDETINCIFAKRADEYNHKEWLYLIDTIKRDPRLRPGMNRIYQYAENSTSPTKEQIRDYVNIFQKADNELGQRKVAFIAPKPLIFGMTRMYELMRNNSVATFHVCETFEQAKKWVGLPAEFENPFPTFDKIETTE